MYTEYNNSNEFFRNSETKKIYIKTLHDRELIMLLFHCKRTPYWRIIQQLTMSQTNWAGQGDYIKLAWWEAYGGISNVPILPFSTVVSTPGGAASVDMYMGFTVKNRDMKRSPANTGTLESAMMVAATMKEYKAQKKILFPTRIPKPKYPSKLG